jgi:hypothetical protein
VRLTDVPCALSACRKLAPPPATWAVSELGAELSNGPIYRAVLLGLHGDICRIFPVIRGFTSISSRVCFKANSLSQRAFIGVTAVSPKLTVRHAHF